MVRTRLLPDLVLLAVAVIWGGSYLAAKDLAEASSAAAAMCLRFVPAAVILLVIAAGRGRLRALRDVSGPGLLLGVAGIALLVSDNGFTAPNLGDLLVLFGAVTRAMLGVAEAHVTAGERSDVFSLTTVELAFGAVIFTIWGGGTALTPLSGFTGYDWALLAYLTIGCTLLAFLGQLWATKRTSASRAGILLGTEPGWALAIGIVFAGDAIGATGLLGALILLGAVTWGGRAENQWRRTLNTTAASRPPQPRA